jgi:hypothetical protein
MMQRKEARKILGFTKKESQDPLNAIQVSALRHGSVPRYSACEGQGQTKAEPAQSAASLDSAPQNRKQPSADLGEDQRIATAGETVPIVFCKRTSDIGGAWLQPSLLKTGTEQFVSRSLYAISQGEIVSNPELSSTFIGTQQIRTLSDGTIQLAHEYSTAATLAASPTTCPIVGGGLWCGIDSVSLLAPFIPAELNQPFTLVFAGSQFFLSRQLTEGVGDTTNTVFTGTSDPLAFINSGTGEDVTIALLNFLGEPIPSPLVDSFKFNAVESGGIIVGGRAVGTITSTGYIDFNALAAAIGLEPGQFVTVSGTITDIDTQINPSNPPSSGTLFGIRQEIVLTPFANPDNVPTADNSSFADTTFLTVTGTISDSDDGGTFPPTKQLSIYYEQGVKVDLYSFGTEDGEYVKAASNQLVDLLMYMFTLYKRADGVDTAEIASPIFTGNMSSIAIFCDEYKLHFNGVVDQAINIIDFAVTIAPFFLLSFLSIGGQYRLEPILPVTESNEIDLTAITPVETFDEDNILPGTVTKSFRLAEDRRPFVAVMLYRESDPNRISVQKTVSVAFDDTAIDAPEEQFDLSSFCVDPDHAAIYGKYQLARRKHITHTISFDTALVLTSLEPTQIIKIQRQRINSAGDDRTEIDFYQVTDISYNADGSSTIEAEHFPLDENDIAVISNEVINGTFRVLL